MRLTDKKMRSSTRPGPQGSGAPAQPGGLDDLPGAGEPVRLAGALDNAEESAPPAVPGPAQSEPQDQPSGERTGGRWRVLLVDDHRLMREGLQALLEEEADIEVVGQAGNGVEAVQMAEALRPDVVVMDVLMPIMDGVEAARRIVAQHPEIRIIGLSMFDETDMARKMLQAGAHTYLPKAGPASELLAAIRER